MKITQLNKLCENDNDVLDLGERIGKIMLKARQDAESGKTFELPAPSDETELDRACYTSGYAMGKRKAPRKAVKPTDLFGHF